MPGLAEALKMGVKGVNRPERVYVDIGRPRAVSSVPQRQWKRSASAGVNSAS